MLTDEPGPSAVSFWADTVGTRLAEPGCSHGQSRGFLPTLQDFGCRLSLGDYSCLINRLEVACQCLTVAVEGQVSEPQPAFLLPHSLWSLDLHLHFQCESLELSEHVSLSGVSLVTQ